MDNQSFSALDNTMTTTVKFELPEILHLDEHAIKMNLAVHLYQTRQCHIGQAAEIAGISKREFIETMGAFGGSMFADYTVEDLKSDVEIVRNRF